MAVLSIRRTASPPPPTEGRQRLAEAIANLQQAETQLAAVEAARQWDGAAAVAERTAKDALATAETALQQAQEDAATALVSQSMGSPTVPAMTVRAARAAVQAAEDDLSAAVQARATLEGRLKPATDAVYWAHKKVEERALDVMRGEAAPAIEALLERIRTVHREVVDLGLTLNALCIAGIIPKQGPNAYPGALELWCRFTHGAEQWTIARTEGASPTSAKWKAALEGLKMDAATPLPGV